MVFFPSPHLHIHFVLSPSTTRCLWYNSYANDFQMNVCILNSVVNPDSYLCWVSNRHLKLPMSKIELLTIYKSIILAVVHISVDGKRILGAILDASHSLTSRPILPALPSKCAQDPIRPHHFCSLPCARPPPSPFHMIMQSPKHLSRFSLSPTVYSPHSRLIVSF